MLLIQFAVPEVLAVVHFSTKENAYGKLGKAPLLKTLFLQALPLNLDDQESHVHSLSFHSFSKRSFRKTKKIFNI